MMLIKEHYWNDGIFNDSEVRVEIARCKVKKNPGSQGIISSMLYQNCKQIWSNVFYYLLGSNIW